MWSVPRDWAGETVFILAGGPSVLDLDLSLLKGRRVIAINSAWKAYPDADALFFADWRWWTQFKPQFEGLCVSTGGSDNRVKKLVKVAPDAMATDPRNLALKSTSVTGAINLALHFGAAKIVLLGVDGKLSTAGRRHCHDEKYPWAMKAGCFDEHAAEFRKIAPSIPVPVLNCSPASTLDAWPKMTLEQALET